MTGKQVIKLLESMGWEVARVRGSHHQMKKGGKRTTVPVHGSKDLHSGTMSAIKRQTGEQLG